MSTDFIGIECDLNGCQGCVCRVKPIPHKLADKRVAPRKVITGASIHAQAPTYVLTNRAQRGG